MIKTISPIIQAQELLAIYEKPELIIVDVSNGPNAMINYEEKHLAGAIFVDLNTQLADIKEDLSNGGRHPLPPIERFSKTLSNMGISFEKHVVVYDDKYGSNAAARFWWMLKAIGHPKVQVLNGGLDAAIKVGFPVQSGIVIPQPSKPYPIIGWQLPLADIYEVEQASHSPEHLIIDVRDSTRYNGETEPIDLIAGHIPGAVNIPFSTNLDAKGQFLSPSETRKIYGKVFEKVMLENVIVHCGSGVTACHTLLAMDYAGFKIPKLYVGSWSEWSRNEKPIARNLK